MTNSTDCPFYTLQWPPATKINKATGSFTQNLGGTQSKGGQNYQTFQKKKKSLTLLKNEGHVLTEITSHCVDSEFYLKQWTFFPVEAVMHLFPQALFKKKKFRWVIDASFISTVALTQDLI